MQAMLSVALAISHTQEPDQSKRFLVLVSGVLDSSDSDVDSPVGANGVKDRSWPWVYCSAMLDLDKLLIVEKRL